MDGSRAFIVLFCVIISANANYVRKGSARNINEVSLEGVICEVPYNKSSFCAAVEDCKLDLNKYATVNTISCEINKKTSTWDRFGMNKDDESLKRQNELLKHKNYHLLPPDDDCGLPPNSKYQRGGYADLTDYTWSALLKYDTKKEPFRCGGSLINNRYVLTAAHCVVNDHNLVGVRLGEFDLDSDVDCIKIFHINSCKDPHRDLEINSADITIHPDYNSSNFQNDIALIRLPEKIDFTDFIQPICLPFTKSAFPIHSNIYTVVGWGCSKKGISSNVLRYADVVKINNSECDHYLMESIHTGLSDKQICSCEFLNQSPCFGDSGGALINAVQNDIRDVQYGIISIKPAECDTTPIIHTKVASYLEWILDNIKP